MVSSDVHPALAIVIMWCSILWMSMVEGGQCSMVGLPPVNRELYRESHPKTHRICSVGHDGDQLNRYLLGRQFLVVFINFTVNVCSAPLNGSINVFDFPEWLKVLLLSSQISLVLIIVTRGQLTSQVRFSC